jgi:hypothetical protein
VDWSAGKLQSQRKWVAVNGFVLFFFLMEFLAPSHFGKPVGYVHVAAAAAAAVWYVGRSVPEPLYDCIARYRIVENKMMTKSSARKRS